MVMISAIVGQGFETRFERTHGVHQFESADNTPVTVVSASGWEEFMDLLRTTEVPAGGFVLTPELMTSPYRPGKISGREGEVMRRTIAVQGLSMSRTGVNILLGTADFAPSGPHAEREQPTNGLVNIYEGMRMGSAQKRVMNSRKEKKIFRPGDSEGYVIGQTIGGLVCADLSISVRNARMSHIHPREIEPTVFPDSVKTLLVSSCWAIPLVPLVFPGNETHYRDKLLEAVEHTFAAYPKVEEIIMADRQAPGVNSYGPFNAHFVRK